MSYDIRFVKAENEKKCEMDESHLGFSKFFTPYMFQADYNTVEGWHDCRIVPYGPLMLDPASVVFHYAQSVFEGMKAYRSPSGDIFLFRPDMNDRRLRKSCERMCIPPLPEGLLVDAVENLVSVVHDWVPSREGTALYIRPFIFGTQPAFGVHASTTYEFVVIATPAGAYYEANNSGLNTTRIFIQDEYKRSFPGGTGCVKAGGNYGGAMRAGVNAAASGCRDVLWLDGKEGRYVEEVGTSNAFFVFDDEVATASLDDGTILPGITRDSVIRLLCSWGVKVSERKVSLEEVLEGAVNGRLREVFSSGTACVISPIGSLTYRGREYVVNGNAVGELSQKLYSTLYSIQSGRGEDLYGWTRKVPVFQPLQQCS